jgi:hypothetical protein
MADRILLESGSLLLLEGGPGALLTEATSTTFAAAFAPSIGPFNASFSGTGSVPATFAPSLGGLAADFEASATVAATLAPTIGPLTASFTASATAPTFTAAFAPTLGPLTAAFDASAIIAATFAPALGPLTAAFNASATGPVGTSDLAATIGALSASFSATPAVPATFAPSLGGLSASFDASVIGATTFTPALGPLTASLTASATGPTYAAAFAPTLGPLAADFEASATGPGATPAALNAAMGGLSASFGAVAGGPAFATLDATLGNFTVFISATTLVQPSDRAAYDAIEDLLRSTNEFSDVVIGSVPFDSSQWENDSGAIAHIQTGVAIDVSSDGSPTREFRRVDYLLTLAIINTRQDHRAAYRELDRLEGVVRNTLLGRGNKAYGGFCRPQYTMLSAGRIDQSRHPVDMNRMSGRFAYTVSLRTGYDPVED